MPLIAHNDLPTYDRLLGEGRVILPPDRAYQQDIRELHIGFLNMMPDAALEATERQFFRLIGESNKIAQFHIHPFNIPPIQRSEEALAHINKYYEPWEKIKEDGLDALIITGANADTNPPVRDIEGWKELTEVLDWAKDNVASILCSCLSSHFVMSYWHNSPPTRLPQKRFGIYSHRVINREHPITRSMNTIVDMPHARNNGLSEQQFLDAGMDVLISGEDSGVHMAASKDGIRLVCMQGHPEYDTFSILKEYRRDLVWYHSGKIDKRPPYPHKYFNDESIQAIEAWEAAGAIPETFPEKEIEKLLENTWHDSARAMIANWIGAVYQVTNVDRKKQFMDGINPGDPFNQYQES